MSQVPDFTGGGGDDPSTVSQFNTQRTYTGAGSLTQIVSNTSALQVLPPSTGPVVTLQYNGVNTVSSGTGIDVDNTTPGVAVVNNTGVLSITTNTPSLLAITNTGGPAGTGEINLDVLGGGGGGGGGVSEESFSIAMGNDFNLTNTGTDATLTDFIDTVNVLGTPDIDPATLHNNLTTGTLNLGTGEFTVGTTGRYLVTWPNCNNDQIYIRLRVNGVKMVPPVIAGEAVTNSVIANLTAGDVLTLTVFDNAVTTITAVSTTISGVDVYTVLWGVALIAPGAGGGGGGGGGGVASVSAENVYITVDNTDPANPIIGNGGVRTVSAGNAYIGVNNADPKNPVISNNGVRTLSLFSPNPGLSLTGTANAPILRNTGVLSVQSSNPTLLGVSTNNGVVTLTPSSSGGGGGGGGGVTGVSAVLADGTESPNLGLQITGATAVQIMNKAVLRVTGGSGISIAGDQRNRTISVGQLGSGSNYTVFDPSTGFQTMSGSARYYRTETIPMIYYSDTPTQAPGANEIYATSRSWFPSFRNAANINSLTGFWPIPMEVVSIPLSGPSFTSTSIFSLGLNWCANTAASGNVVWRVRVRFICPGLANAAPFFLKEISATAPYTDLSFTRAASGAGIVDWTGYQNYTAAYLSGGYILPGSLLAVSVQRDPDVAGDTYPDQALFMGLRVSYQCDQLGSRTLTTK